AAGSGCGWWSWRAPGEGSWVCGTMKLDRRAFIRRRGRRGAPALLDAAGFVEAQPRGTREDAGGIALAEVDQDVGADRGAGEEGGVDLGVVEAAHRPAVQAQRARGQDQVGGLQAAAAHRHPSQVVLAALVEPGLG